MQRFMCDIVPTDELHTYTTDKEHPVIQHFAMVMVTSSGQRASVLLTREQAIALGNQLQDFIVNGHKA